jgi:hypothetical protein
MRTTGPSHATPGARFWRRAGHAAWLWLIPILAVLGPGCRDSSGTLVLLFPSEGAFLAAAAARITIYDAQDDVELCRQLVRGQQVNNQPVLLQGFTDVCQYRDDGAALPKLDLGVRAIFVEVVGKGSDPIMKGCRTVFLDDADDTIQLELALTTAYDANRRQTNCTTAADRCDGACQ